MALAKIKLNREWRGHAAGEVIETSHDNAHSLVNDGAAEWVVETTPQPKAVRKPPANKMVSGKKARNK